MSTFIQQAECGRTGTVFLLLGGVALVLGTLLGGAGLSLALLKMFGGSIAAGSPPYGLSPPAFVAVSVAPHVAALGIVWACVRGLHRRAFRTLVTGATRVDWGRLGVAAAGWGSLWLMALGAGYVADPDNYRLVVEVKPFLATLAAVLILIPVQAATEELILRGYLMQEVGAVVGNGWSGLLITSLLFGALHGANPEVASLGTAPMMTYYVGFGLLAGGLTLVDGRLELAIGMHVVNNVLGTIVVTYPDSVLPLPALVRLQAIDVTWVVSGFAVAAVAFAAITTTYYGWTWDDLQRGLGPVHPSDDALTDNAPKEDAPTDSDATSS